MSSRDRVVRAVLAGVRASTWLRANARMCLAGQELSPLSRPLRQMTSSTAMDRSLLKPAIKLATLGAHATAGSSGVELAKRTGRYQADAPA